MRPERVNQGHCGVATLPMDGYLEHEITAAYAPAAQRRGNLVVLDVRRVLITGVPCWRATVVHVNSCGTDANDLARFAEDAARRLEIVLPEDYQPISDIHPIRKVSRPHAGSPRPATQRRRGVFAYTGPGAGS